MRIFVYEHITGGGMLDDPQVAALAPEGEMMLRALVDDLMLIPGVEVTVLRDARLPDDLPATDTDPAETHRDRAGTQRALAALSDLDRELVALRFGAGHTNRAIADLLGLTEANVAQRLRRALLAMRRTLEEGR